jgi:hypothetical protein
MFDSMIHARMSAAILCLSALLAGCNETGPGASGPVAAAPAEFSAQRLPAGAGCTKVIETYHGVVRSDLETGNLEQKVYDEIEHELEGAATACEAGHDGQARSIVATSKERHGYHS